MTSYNGKKLTSMTKGAYFYPPQDFGIRPGFAYVIRLKIFYAKKTLTKAFRILGKKKYLRPGIKNTTKIRHLA